MSLSDLFYSRTNHPKYGRSAPGRPFPSFPLQGGPGQIRLLEGLPFNPPGPCLRQASATMRFRTPKTKVNKLPMKIIAVEGYSLITGTASSPQLSPAKERLSSEWQQLSKTAEQLSRESGFSGQSHGFHPFKASASLLVRITQTQKNT